MPWQPGTSSSGGGGGGVSTLSNVDAQGTTPVSAGSIYIEAGTYDFRAFIGCVDPAHTASLELRRTTTGAVLTTLGGVAGALQNRSAGGVVVANSDWYEVRLSCNNTIGVAMFRGLSYK